VDGDCPGGGVVDGIGGRARRLVLAGPDGRPAQRFGSTEPKSW